MEYKSSTKAKITPFLWFDGQAEEAIQFYTAIFNDSKASGAMRMPDGKVLTQSFQLAGQPFIALNGGPHFKFNPSISFFVMCHSEAEANEIWEKLMVSGSVLMPLDTYEWSKRYGWGQDKFGLSWQVMLQDNKIITQKILPCLMFADKQLEQADEAIQFYMSLFKDSRVGDISRYTAKEPAPKDAVKYAEFNLDGQPMVIMGSAMPHNFEFNEAISFVISCDDQAEVDYYWNTMIEGNGQESQCGWLKDKYGVSWQVVPSALDELMSNKDSAKSQRVMQALRKMQKLDIEVLQQA